MHQLAKFGEDPSNCCLGMAILLLSRLRPSLIYGRPIPYVIGQAIYVFILSFVLLLSFSSPNLSRRRLDVYYTFTHGVALLEI